MRERTEEVSHVGEPPLVVTVYARDGSTAALRYGLVGVVLLLPTMTVVPHTDTTTPRTRPITLRNSVVAGEAGLDAPLRSY